MTTRLIAADPSGESRRISIKIKNKTKHNTIRKNGIEKKLTKTAARVCVQRRLVRISASTFGGLTARR